MWQKQNNGELKSIAIASRYLNDDGEKISLAEKSKTKPPTVQRRQRKQTDRQARRRLNRRKRAFIE